MAKIIHAHEGYQGYTVAELHAILGEWLEKNPGKGVMPVVVFDGGDGWIGSIHSMAIGQMHEIDIEEEEDGTYYGKDPIFALRMTSDPLVKLLDKPSD